MAISNILKKLNRRDTKFLPRLSKFSKVIIFSVLAISTVFFVKNILAADSLIKQKQDAIQTGNNQESWINESLSSNLVSTQILMAGTIPDNVLNGTATSYVPGGLLGATNQLVASAFTQPISGVQYLAQVKDNFLGKPTYAADGVGFTGLSKLLPLWKTFRNMVYSISAIIFVIVGIMIMLRVKISPQAVISIQNSIPKIITTLILVTFSYAIAGLCIDLLNFVLAFVLALLFNGTGKDLSKNLFDLNLNTNSYDILRNLTGDSPFNFSNLNNAGMWTLSSLIMRTIPTLAMAALGGIIGGIAGLIISVGNPLGGLAGLGIGAILILLIMEIIIAISVIKFLFGLVKCYVNIILKVITGPLEIALGAFPNSKMGFSKWILDIIANIAVFPISILFLVIVNIIMDAIGGGLWVPPLLGINGVSAAGDFLPAMVGIASILMLAKLPSMIPEFIFQIKPSPWGKAIGEGFAPYGKMATSGAKFGISSAGASMEENSWDHDPLTGARTTLKPGRGAKAKETIGKAMQYFTHK